MKKSLVALALLAAFAAQAQDSNSTSQSGSNSGSNSTSASGAVAVGNQNSSTSGSASGSDARSGSISGAAGNVINLDQSVPSLQTVNSNATSTSTVNGTQTVNGSTHQSVSGGTTNTDNIRYSGEVTNRNINEGTTTNRVEYSGTQTLKNVPSIAMSGPASGPCTGVSGGISAVGPGWGVGFNGSSVMDDCRMRENTRVMGMAMQSLDGAAQPQEKGEATVMFMDALRGLAAYNNTLIQANTKQAK